MAFENVRRILAIGSPLSSLKLLLAIGTSSRPRLKWLYLSLLKPLSRQNELSIEYRCYGRLQKAQLRLSDLNADTLSILELCTKDTYRLDANFMPDLVIDGGGNIGLFTLRVAALASSTTMGGGDGGPRITVCEPLPRNIAQIRKHLDTNHVNAEVLPYCLGGTRRTIPFYCRAANQSSFEDSEPYVSVLEIPVVLLEDIAKDHPGAQRIMIKLDIEGMEIEALDAFVPSEKRAVYVVGELHNVPVNRTLLEEIFRKSGWTAELFDIDVETSSFRACSPAAVPLLTWAQRVLERSSAVA